MPITTEHGGQASSAAGEIIAKAGQGNLNREARLLIQQRQLAAQKEAQSQAIEASFAQKHAAIEAEKEMLFQRAGLKASMQQQEQQERLKELQVKAQIDAATFEKRYTQKQKLEIARIKKAKQSVMNSPNFDDREKQAAIRTLELQELGITPSDLPKMAPWPKGEGVGEAVPKYGGIVTRNPDGSHRILFRPDQMPEWHEKEMQAKQKQAELDLEDEKRKRAWELMTKGVYTGSSKLGEERRAVDYKEAQRIVEQLYRKPPPEWAMQAEEGGMKVDPDDYELPGAVGYAKTFITTMKEQFGQYKVMPPELKEKYRNSLKVLEEYKRQR